MQNRIVNRSFAVLMAVVFTFASVFAAGTLNVSAATKLSVSPSSSTVSVGGSATIKSNKAVKWSVSKGSSVVKLVKKSSKSVVVKGLKEGTGYIKAKAGSSSKTVKVVVKAAKGEVTKGEAKKGRMVININLSKSGTAYAQEGKVAKVWVPIPESDKFQTISNFKYDADFTTVNKITRDSAGNKVLYLEWGANVAPEDRTARVEYSITRYAIKSTKMVEKGSIPQSIKDEYLGEFETSGSLTSGIVKQTSDKIVADANAKTTLEKAKAIFDWTVQNLYRRETAVDDLKFSGCGRGQVEIVLETTKGGKCTDINSTFVALCRSQGVPAREKFGIRLNNGASGNANGNEHCRCEFYLPGTGWIEADPADTLKVLLKEDGISYESGKIGADRVSADRWAVLYGKYWGANDNNWVKLAEGRDITLEPAQTATGPSNDIWYRSILNESGKLNNMGYVYGETDGEYMDTYSPAKFGYMYKFYAE